MSLAINYQRLSEDQFINIMQEIGKDSHTYKYRNYISVIKQQYVRFSILPKNITNLVHLFKGLVLCERDFNWGGGSVASNIQVFQAIKDHSFIKASPEKFNEIIDWALKNRGTNGYTPFGSWRYHGCRSLEDMISWDQDRKDRIAKQIKKEQEIARQKARKIAIQKKIKDLRPIRRNLKRQSFDLNIELFLLLNRNERTRLIFQNKLNFPINLLPQSCWKELLLMELSVDQIKLLLNIIPKNSSEYIKNHVKPALQRKRKLSLV